MYYLSDNLKSETGTRKLALFPTASAALVVTPLCVLPDETIVPPDVPSYLSSQGTLSERQEVCIRVDAGGGPQPNGHVVEATGTVTVRLLQD